MNEYLVLLAEDSDTDFDLTEIALQGCVRDLRLCRVANGEQAIAFMQHSGEFIGMPLPSLVLLDINLPKKSGFEVLEFMKSQEAVRRLPVVMFTSSSNDSDKERARLLGADDFVTKPMYLDEMISELKSICVKYLPKPVNIHTAELKQNAST